MPSVIDVHDHLVAAGRAALAGLAPAPLQRLLVEVLEVEAVVGGDRAGDDLAAATGSAAAAAATAAGAAAAPAAPAPAPALAGRAVTGRRHRRRPSPASPLPPPRSLPAAGAAPGGCRRCAASRRRRRSGSLEPGLVARLGREVLGRQPAVGAGPLVAPVARRTRRPDRRVGHARRPRRGSPVGGRARTPRGRRHRRPAVAARVALATVAPPPVAGRALAVLAAARPAPAACAAAPSGRGAPSARPLPSGRVARRRSRAAPSARGPDVSSRRVAARAGWRLGVGLPPRSRRGRRRRPALAGSRGPRGPRIVSSDIDAFSHDARASTAIRAIDGERLVAARRRVRSIAGPQDPAFVQFRPERGEQLGRTQTLAGRVATSARRSAPVLGSVRDRARRSGGSPDGCPPWCVLPLRCRVTRQGRCCHRGARRSAPTTSGAGVVARAGGVHLDLPLHRGRPPPATRAPGPPSG